MEGSGKGWGSRWLLSWGGKLCSSNEKAEGKPRCLPSAKSADRCQQPSWTGTGKNVPFPTGQTSHFLLLRLSWAWKFTIPANSCHASADAPHPNESSPRVTSSYPHSKPQGGCHYCLPPSEEAALRDAVTQLRAHSSQMDENPAQVNLTPKPMLRAPSSLMPISSMCIDAIIHCARHDARIRYKLSLISSQQPCEGSPVSSTLQVKKMRPREVK